MKNKLTTKVSLVLLMILTFVVLLGISAGATEPTVITGGDETLTLTSGKYVLNDDITRNIIIGSGAEVTIDLNGHVLRGTGNGSVITIQNGQLFLIDNGPGVEHYFKVGTDAEYNLWELVPSATDAKSISEYDFRPAAGDIIMVPGGIITGGNATQGGGINNVYNFKTNKTGSLTMFGGSIVGNQVTNAGGGIFSGKTGTLYIETGCYIAGNTSTTSTGGIHIGNVGANIGANVFANTAKINVGGIKVSQTTGVTISGQVIGNKANRSAGGVYIDGLPDVPASLTISGKVTGNICGSGPSYTGGGVYLADEYVTLTLSKSANITGNKKGSIENNLYLSDTNKRVILSNPMYGMKVGITTQSIPTIDNPITITDVNEDNYCDYFVSDNINFGVINTASSEAVHIVKLSIPVVKNVETGRGYGTLQQAIKAAQSGETLQLLLNNKEKVTIGKGQEIIIDLNGFVLQGIGSDNIVLNEGTVTITDLSLNTYHFFVYNKEGAWTITDTDTSFITLAQITSATDTGAIIKIPGGVITGANGNSAIANSGTMVLENVNIIGNDAGEKYGGGVKNDNGASLTVVDCIIAGNKAANGGGIYAAGSDGDCFAEGTNITMADGSVLSIEDIRVGDKVLSFNHETGKYESQKVIIAYAGEWQDPYFTLHFADGTTLDICDCHDLFEQSACRYVTVSTENATEFIGKYFYNAASKSWVKLESVTYCDEKVNFYSIYVAGTINCIANGMLTIPDDMEPLMQIYEFNADLTVNAEALQAEIDTYGLLAYEDSPYVLSREKFDALNLRFWNIFIGRGYVTAEELDAIYNEWYRELDLQLTNAQLFGSAVLFSAEETSELTISGKTLIFGNVNVRGNANNVYLCNDKTICVDSPDASMMVGVTLAGKTGVATTAADDSFAKYFFSDNDAYVAFDTGVAGALQVYIGNPVAVISETNLRYASLTDAIKAADTTPSTIILLCDVTENVTIPDAATITIDLDGYVWQSVADTDEHIIDNNGTLTIIDSNTHNQTHNYKVNAKGVWVLTDDEYTKTFASLTDIPAENDVICVPGGVITGSKLVAIANINTLKIAGGNIIGNAIDDVQAGIIHHHSGEMTITAGNIVGNGIHAVVCEGSTLTMDGGCIAYNNGIGVAIDDESSFYLKNGVIRGNSIGGVNNTGTFLMTGGLITGNKAEMGAGVYSCGTITIGGTAQIYGNTATDCGDNLTIYAPIALGTGTDAPADGMIVGISLLDGDDAIKAGAVTKETTVPYAKYFFSDNDAYVAFNTGKPTAMQVYIGNPVAVISETNLEFPSIAKAIEAAGTTPTTIKLLCDAEENVTIPAGADITLDLNGHVLDLGGKHILNQGILTIEDSDPDAVHTGTLTDYVGGIITNGNANDVDPILQGIGGAIVVCKNGSDAALIMNAGTIVNCTALNGGAIFVGEGATFTMNGGTITHCTAERGGAIGNYKGSATIAGTIAYCTATNYGGAIYNEGDNTTKATTILNDGAVINNCAAFGGTDQMGGGIFNKGTLVMNAGAVIENCTAEKGAGVHNHGADWVTFTMNGGTIQNNTAAKNGGGVQNSDKATFVMNGGTITGNTAKESLAGGVFTKGKMTVQGTASIYGNYTGTSTQKASNLAVVKGYPITVASNTGLLYVSVIEKDGSYKVITGNFTTATATDDNSVFFPDDSDNYEIRSYRNANGIASMLAGKTPVCEITSEGDYMGNRYDTLAQAIIDIKAAATPTTIKLLQPLDLTETYQLPDYTTVVINDKWIETNSYNLYVGKDCVFEVASQRDLEIALYVVPRNGSDKSYTLKLTQDIHVSKPIKVDYGYFKSLTIDGNGYVFTATASDTAPAQSHVLYFYNDVNFYKEVKLNNVVINVGNGFRGGICVDKTADAANIAVDLDNVTIIADRTKAPLGSDMTEKTGTLIQNNGNEIFVKGQLKLVTDAYCWSAMDLDKNKGNIILAFMQNAAVSVTDLRTDASKIKEPLVGLSGTSANVWNVVGYSQNGVKLLFAAQDDLNPNDVTGMRCKDGYDVEIHTHNWVYTATGTTITASCAGTAHVCHTMAFATNTSISIKAPTALTYNGQNKNATLIGTSIVGQDALPAITYQYKTGANGAYAPAANTANAGYYKASVTIGGATVYVEYYVAQAAVSEPFTVDTYVYDGSELTLSLIGVQDFMTLSGETKAVLAGPHTVEIALDLNHTWADGADGKITWVIDPATAVIDVDTKAIVATYGDIIVLPTASSNVGTVACSTTADELINAGTYVVTYRVVTTSNYAGSEKTLTVTILPLAVGEPTVEDITRTYTGEEYVVTISDVASYVTVGGDVSGTDAGIYVITYTLDNNHVWASGSDGVYTWTIDKANAVIDVDTTEIVKTYGDVWTLPVAVSTYGDVVCDKTIADMKNAGTYVVTYTVASTTNYNGDEKTITVTVKPLAVNEPVVSGAYVYDGSEKKAVVSGVADYMTVSGVDKATAAGTYTLTYTLDNNHVWANGADGNKLPWIAHPSS